MFDLTKTAQGLPENLARKFAKQVLSALKYLHDNNVVHRDIKLENVVVNDNLDAELIDFGFAESRDDLSAVPRNTAGSRGTKGYLAPELDKANEVKDEQMPIDLTKIDMFSFGVFLFTMVVGCPPF